MSPGSSAPLPLSQRLVDAFEPGFITGTAQTSELPRTEWRFAGAAAKADTLGWEVVEGSERLQVREGRLVGRTTSDLPILHALRAGGEENTDQIHEIRIRLKVSAGTEVGMHFVGPAPGPMDGLQARRFFWVATAPIIADGEMRTVSFRPVYPIASSEIREVFLRPANSAGADFEIEWIRLVFRLEQLAEHPSGVGWYGLDGDFREAVAARSPETIRWPLTLPEQPRLEIGLGTFSDHSVTFKVSLMSDGGEDLLVERTLSTPERWEDVGIDLDAYANETVTLRLDLEAASGTPALWGTPAVRNRIASRDWGEEEEIQGVILILADTLRFDRLSFYGHERSTAPNLGRLAEEGALFRKAYSHAPWTRPAAPSIVTSLYPTSHTVRGFLDRLPNSALTLAETFRQAGWATLGFSAVPHTGRSANMQQGYENLHEGIVVGQGSKTARVFVDRLLPWIDVHHQDRFFIFLHLFDPHYPYEPPPPYDTMWADPTDRQAYERQLASVSRSIAHPLRAAQGMAHRDELNRAGVESGPYVEYRRAWYDGSIRFMDEELGRLFGRLTELGLTDRTLVLLTSDHGEEFLDHDWMGHGHSLYDELIRVPLFLWKPGLVPAGVVIEEPVQHVDLMPTILELCGLPVPATAQGQSLVPILAGAASETELPRGSFKPSPIVSERPVSDHPMAPPPRFGSTALIFDGWKLIQNDDGRVGRPAYELYDQRTEPRDSVDLAAERPEVVARLKEMLAAWRRMVESSRLPSDAALSRELSADELERLRSLGYIQ